MAPVKLVLSPATASVALGENTLQITATLYDQYGAVVDPTLTLKWSSSNTAILTVDSDGLCTTAAVQDGVLNVGGQVTVSCSYPWGGIPNSTSVIYGQSVLTVNAPAAETQEYFLQTEDNAGPGSQTAAAWSSIAKLIP